MKKLLVFGVIVLFISVSVIPSTGTMSQFELEYELMGGFGITVIVTNTGSEYFRGGIFCNYTINGPIVLTKSGSGINLIRIEPDDTEKLTKIRVIGLGPFTINVNLTARFGPKSMDNIHNIEENGFVLGFFVILFQGGKEV